MTVKELDEKIQESILNKQKLTDRQRTAEMKAQTLNAEAETAAASGDVEKYRELRSQATEQGELAYVLKKQIERDEGNVCDADVTEAWARYRAEYEKKLNAGLKTFRESKMNMLRQYAEMVTLQRDACATRERLTRYLGREVAPLAGGKDRALETRFSMEYIPNEECLASIMGANVEDADAIYYLANLGIKDAVALSRNVDAQKIVNVVRYHRA